MRNEVRQAVYRGLYRSVGRVVSDRISNEHISDPYGQRIKYLALSTLVSRQLPDGMPLSAYELSVFSQNGEDGILFELCRRLKVSPSFVEFGIETGIEGNCVMLADVFGWSGVFMEGSPSDYEQLALKYMHHAEVKTRPAVVTPANVESLFSEEEVPHDLGVLSIDIDGNDYWVWSAIESWQPTIVIIEFNSLLSFDDRLVQPYCEEIQAKSSFFGASLGAIENLGKSKGYHLVHADLAGVNAFLVRSDAAGELTKVDTVAKRGLNYYLRGARYRHPPTIRDDWVRV
jgi:hypothetical protein